MPIPKKVTNDFFVPPINPFFIEENNEAVIMDDDFYDYVPFFLSFDSFIVDFDSNQVQDIPTNAFENCTALESIALDLDICEIVNLLDKLITNKRYEIHNKLINQIGHNSKQKCLKSKEFEYTFLTNGFEYTFLSNGFE